MLDGSFVVKVAKIDDLDLVKDLQREFGSAVILITCLLYTSRCV